jgi:hypothetical protein
MDQAARNFNDAQALPDEADATVHAVHADEAAPVAAVPRTSLVSSHAQPAPLPQYDDEDEFPYPPRTGFTFRRVMLGIAAFVVIGMAFVAYALFSDSSDSEDMIVDQTTSHVQDARTTTGTIAPFAPAQTNHPAAAIKPAAPASVAKLTPPAAVAPAAPPTSVTSVTPTAPVVPVTPPVVATPARPAPALQFRDAAQALQAARLAFRANDLSAAQAALGASLALQPGNSNAQALASELRPLTARRDSALQAAQTCVSQQSWSCAREHANEALTIDTGNDAAKGILERVIRETGWAPLNTRPAVSQQAQVQTPLPPGMPATGAPSAAAPRTGAAGTAAAPANSVDARERAIKDSGWNRAPATGARSSAGTSSGQ